MALTVGKASSGNISLGQASQPSLSIGTNTGMPATAPAYGVTLGQSVINQTPITGGGSGGGGGGGTTPTAPTGGSALPALNTGAINNTQIAIDQLPGLLQAALDAESRSRNNTLNAFNTQENQQRGTYDQSTVTNQQNYDANYMDSIRAGIKGMGGLLGILRGTGAGGGTAEDMVRETVGGVTANDIRTGADTQRTNQTGLDTALSTFLTELSGKKQAAEDTFTNNQRAIQRDNQTQLQDLYGKMAGFYGDAGRTAQAQDFMSRAGSLTPSIAANSRTAVSNYDTTPVAVQAPSLTAFAAPSQPDVATAPADGQVGSGIFTMSRRREQETPQLATVGV